MSKIKIHEAKRTNNQHTHKYTQIHWAARLVKVNRERERERDGEKKYTEKKEEPKNFVLKIKTF